MHMFNLSASKIQPFVVVSAFIGDAFNDHSISWPNNDDIVHDNNDEIEDIIQSLNENQRRTFDQIFATVRNLDNIQGNMFFIDGPGGSGKTYLNNIILKYLPSKGNDK
jgi:predicted ATPase